MARRSTGLQFVIRSRARYTNHAHYFAKSSRCVNLKISCRRGRPRCLHGAQVTFDMTVVRFAPGCPHRSGIGISNHAENQTRRIEGGKRPCKLPVLLYRL
jgi:hypothetical protein